MSNFQVGFSRVNINPPLGHGIAGYYIPRYAKGFLDDLELNTIAFACGEKKIVLISADLCHIQTPMASRFREKISGATGLPVEDIFITCTHTHTGPALIMNPSVPMDEADINRYVDFLELRLCDAATLALADLKPAKMGYLVGHEPDKVAYIRRYKMKDGSTMTCPPVDSPMIDHPLGELDRRVNVLRFDREGADTVVVVNVGIHADTVNGEMISSDWPGWMRRTVERALDNVKCVFADGAAGDVGSTNVHPRGGDMNDTEISFDNEMKSPGMARFVGRALAGTVLQVYDKVNYIDVDDIRSLHMDVDVPSNMPDPAKLPLAKKYRELHEAGRDAEIPYTAMELTTVVAEAARMCKLENGPDHFTLHLGGLKLGGVAMVCIPGEPFTDIGVALKDTPGWDLILPCALTNGSEGYFPMQSAYDEGGYEARSSRFKAGVAETIIAGGKELLKNLQK